MWGDLAQQGYQAPYAGAQPGLWQQASEPAPPTYDYGHHGYIEPPQPHDQAGVGDYELYDHAVGDDGGDHAQTTQLDYRTGLEADSRLRQPAYLGDYPVAGWWPGVEPDGDRGRHRHRAPDGP